MGQTHEKSITSHEEESWSISMTFFLLGGSRPDRRGEPKNRPFRDEEEVRVRHGGDAVPVGVPLITIAINVDTYDTDQTVSQDYHPLL